MVRANTPLSHEDCLLLADAIGESPFTVVSSHLLRCGLCDAFLLGDLNGEWGAIIRDPNVYGEPGGYGNAPELIWELLLSLTDWFCVNVATDLAQPIGEMVMKQMGVTVRYLGDLYYTLTTPVKQFTNEHVRQLGLDDLPLLELAQPEVQAAAFGGPRQALENGFVACAIVENQIVGIAQSYARTERYADIGVHTLPEWRGRGFATAAASIIAHRLQEAGQIPVWSTGENNYISQRVATKLEFTEAGRRMYVILE